MKKLTSVIAMLVLFSGIAFAVDNGTEFGIEDDLTILGTGGNWNDPDADIDGFTFIGGTIPAAQQLVTGQAGNVAISSAVQIGQAGAPMSYFGSSVTVNGYGIFLSTVQINDGNLKVGTGAAGLVLKSAGNGFAYWQTDTVGAGEPSGTARRVPMYQDDGVGLIETWLYGDVAGGGITLLNNSSMTITGAFGANGAAILGSGLTVTGASTFNGNITSTGTVFVQNGVNVTGGNASVTNNLTVNGNAQLGDAVGDLHAINTPTVAGTALRVLGGNTSGNIIQEWYSGDITAANRVAWIKKK